MGIKLNRETQEFEWWTPDFIIGDINIYDYGTLYWEKWTKATLTCFMESCKRVA